ncbi:hypothetical protein [Hyphomicrobium sp. CS1BSMeth3]|nr:hypothetical protein [Hyphomicrobium sp. CS1BSMeth3]
MRRQAAIGGVDKHLVATEDATQHRLITNIHSVAERTNASFSLSAGA